MHSLLQWFPHICGDIFQHSYWMPETTDSIDSTDRTLFFSINIHTYDSLIYKLSSIRD